MSDYIVRFIRPTKNGSREEEFTLSLNVKQVDFLNNRLVEELGFEGVNIYEPSASQPLREFANDMAAEGIYIFKEEELIGKRFVTLKDDGENDDDWGEVKHPAGSSFVVGEFLGGDHDDNFRVLWDSCVDSEGRVHVENPTQSTMWTYEEIQKDAKEVKR